MAKSLNDIVSLLAERSGRTFDIPFQEELKMMVDYWRATVMKQALERNPKDRQHFQQSLVMELIKVPLVECPIEYGCVLRTKEKVPSPLRGGSVLFDYIGRATWDKSYSTTNEAFEVFTSTSPYTGKNVRYAYRDNYLYVYNDKKLKYVGVKGVFENPRDLGQFQCGESSCYTDDLLYPLSEDMIQQVVSAILKTELRILPTEDKVEVPVDKSTPAV